MPLPAGNLDDTHCVVIVSSLLSLIIYKVRVCGEEELMPMATLLILWRLSKLYR